MEMTVETRDVDKTDQMLKRLFARHGFDYELRELNCQMPMNRWARSFTS